MIKNNADQIDQLRTTINKMEIIFNAIDEAVIWANQKGDIQWCNKVFDDLVGKPHIMILGKNIIELFDLMRINPLQKESRHEQLFRVNDKEWLTFEYHQPSQEAELIFQVSARKAELSEHDKSYLIIIRNITEQRKIQRQLEHLAHYDLLTNLPNRRQFETYFEHELAKFHRHKRKFALLFIDVNEFKLINDTYGHEVGDLYLISIAKRLKSTVRKEDFAARIGGDEFVVIISEIETYDATKQVAEKISSALNQSYQLSGNTIQGSASIGISYVPKDGEKLDQVMSIADKRMYEKKQKLTKL